MDLIVRKGKSHSSGTPWKANFKEIVGPCTSSFAGAWMDLPKISLDDSCLIIEFE